MFSTSSLLLYLLVHIAIALSLLFLANAYYLTI
nr:MAG TPA: hypothetical protein [Caudoviricetes sp.]